MSDLSSIEKLKLEKLFDMSSGYVLDFTNLTFAEFILENIGLDIYDSKYDYRTGSKANRLRAFWQEEPNYIVGQLTAHLLEYWKAMKQIRYSEVTSGEQSLYDECVRIAERLKQGSPVEHLDAIRLNVTRRDFSLLVNTIKESIRNNEPELALDRLHTYVVKYLRQLCDNHGIGHSRKMPLNSLLGSYINHLRQNNLIESKMTEKILSSAIQVMEEFNRVRNEQSFAHDNPILNYEESILILNNVASTIKFIQSVEGKLAVLSGVIEDNQGENDWDEIPF